MARKISNLKTLLNHAAKAGHNKSYIFRDFSVKKVKPERNFLTEKKLNLIYNLKSNIRLERVRVVFCFGCFTRLRYSDILTLQFAEIISKIDSDITSNNIEDKSTSNQIFFSYAWGDHQEEGESREKIVNDLYDSLKEDGFYVVRDKADLGYGKSINDFMEKIGKGDLILVFISEKYFKSHFCMYELTEIARNSKFEKEVFANKILPIPIEYIDFTKPAVLTEYFNHWGNEKMIWTDFIQANFEQATKQQYDRYEKTKHIYQYFGHISDWSADLNQMTTPLLSENNFGLMKTTILNRMQRNSNH